MRFDLKDSQGNRLQQYNVFERLLADKLSYYDWKLCYQGSPEEFEFIHKKNKL